MMYLLERNYDLRTKEVFDNLEDAITRAEELHKANPTDNINIAEINELMNTVWKSSNEKEVS